MKILVLRIYNSTKEYDAMRGYHMENDNSICVCYNETLKQAWRYSSKERLIEIRGKDSIVPGMLDKSIKAIEICLGLFDFDFLVRSNISTVIDIQELEKQLEGNTTVYGGHTWNLYRSDLKYGIDENALEKYRNTEYVSGTSIILSRDNCEFLVENNNQLDYSVVDDVAIGVLMKNHNGVNFRTYFVESEIPVKNVCFYRFCTSNRGIDTILMERLYTLIKHKTWNNVHRF